MNLDSGAPADSSRGAGGGDEAATGALPPQITPHSLTELKPGDPAVYQPKTFDEWVAREKTRTFLVTWTDQMVHERALRSLAAKTIFGLIGAQVVAVFAVLVLQGLAVVHLDVKVLQILIPSVLGDVFGLGYVVTKYLFSQPLRHSLDALVRGKDARDAV